MVFHLDTTGKAGVGVAYDIEDLDSSGGRRSPPGWRCSTARARRAPTPTSPPAYVTDATVASNAAVVSTAVSGPSRCPAAADNQADVYVRVITLDNATGSNEHIGIDNINITTVRWRLTP